MSNIKNISYFRENIYKYRDRIDGTCLVAFHYLIDRIEKDILLNNKFSVVEKRGIVEIGIKSSLDRAVLFNEEHNEYSKNCEYKDFTIISEIVYRYYLKYVIPRLRESGFGVYILSYNTDYYGRVCDDYTRVDNELSSNLTSDAELEIEDKDNENIDVLATTTPDLDYDIEDAKEIYRRRLVERSNSVLKSILDLIINCISSGKESIDIDTGIVKGELSKLGADMSDKGLYEIMCWLSTVLSETYDYKLDVVDSFQKDKIYIINISGWA